LIATGLATLFGFFGGLWWIADLCSHFRIGYAVFLTIGLFVCAIRKRWWWAFICLCLAALNSWLLVPYFRTAPKIATAGPELRVIAWNSGMIQSSPELIRMVEDDHPDIILISELTPELDAYLRAHLKDYRPTALPLRGTFGIGAYTNLEVMKGVTPDLLGIPTVELTVRKQNATFYFLGIHSTPPLNEALSERRDRYLMEVNRWAQSMHGRHMVIAGDFNATPFSHEVRALIRDANLEDAQIGHGVAGTWPALFGPVSLPVDLVLHSQSLVTVEHDIGPDLRSYHYPIKVVLRPRADDTVIAQAFASGW
jgi:endonuclease/exonuclease/phosphatase (EEP) superfamily protein YafD